METVVEVMIKKNKTFLDILFQILIVIGGLVICAVANYFIKYLGMISVAIIMLTVWFAYKAVMAFNIEYEYTYVNGDLDIDRIFGKNSRRNFINVPLEKVELVAKADNNEAKKLMYNAKVNNICTDKCNEQNIIVVFSGDRGKEAAIIEFNEEVYNNYKKLIPMKVR